MLEAESSTSIRISTRRELGLRIERTGVDRFSKVQNGREETDSFYETQTTIKQGCRAVRNTRERHESIAIFSLSLSLDRRIPTRLMFDL
jgi:hypothetical protein